MDNKKEYILCAAIHFDDGINHIHQPKNITSGIVICGRRHHNCFTTLLIIGSNFKDVCIKNNTQGFLTSYDRFVNRKEALIIARENNQLLEDKDNKEILISEDLY